MIIFYRKLFVFITVFAAIFNCQLLLAHDDDPLLMHLKLERFEYRKDDDQQLTLVDGEAWIGKDLNKFWIKAEAERHDQATQNAEIQALYSHAMARYWDLQVGVRHDSQPKPSRTWGVIGVEGIAPYFFDIGAALFVDEQGNTASKLKTGYNLLLSQRLIFDASLDATLFGQNDERNGAGLSETELGFRLRYEIFREFAPYIGISRTKQFGKTAELAYKRGDASVETQWLFGLRVWY